VGEERGFGGISSLASLQGGEERVFQPYQKSYPGGRRKNGTRTRKFLILAGEKEKKGKGPEKIPFSPWGYETRAEGKRKRGG